MLLPLLAYFSSLHCQNRGAAGRSNELSNQLHYTLILILMINIVCINSTKHTRKTPLAASLQYYLYQLNCTAVRSERLWPRLAMSYVGCFVGRLYKKTPRFDEIPSLTGQLLIHAISINSGYTSRIVVSTWFRFLYRKVTNTRM